MGRRTTSTSYITPVKSDGVVQTESATEFGRGAYTLALSTTYYYPLAGQDALALHAHLQWDAAIVLTSVTVEECDMPESEVTDHEAGTTGTWLPTSVDRITSTVEGAGATNTSDVIAVSGGAAGGGAMNVSEHGARRTRLKVVVGGTGGELRVASWAKE